MCKVILLTLTTMPSPLVKYRAGQLSEGNATERKGVKNQGVRR
jgi:hypothetical protein